MVLEALDGYGLPIVHHAGTSAGAITAMLRALGYSAGRIRELQAETPWKRFACYRFSHVWRLLRQGGWFSNEFMRSWIAERVVEAGMPEGLTFAGLRHRNGHSLYVGATRYQRYVGGRVEAAPFLFSPDATPDAPIAPAVAASAAVPVFWPAVQVENWWFGDGGIAMNHPVAALRGFEPEQIIGVRLDTGAEILAGSGDIALEPVRPGLWEIVPALFEMTAGIANKAWVPEELWARIVRIDVGKERALDFRARPERIERLRAAGRKALAEWLAGGVV